MLVVEDDAELRRFAARLLEDGELDTIECESAEAALATMLIRGRDVAMVFADIRLPGAMDGIDLTMSRIAPFTTAVMAYTLLGMRLPAPCGRTPYDGRKHQRCVDAFPMTRTAGNLILMTLICVVICIAVMAVRPAPAAELSRKMLGSWCALDEIGAIGRF